MNLPPYFPERGGETPALDRLTDLVGADLEIPRERARDVSRYAVDLFAAILALDPDDHGQATQDPTPSAR